MEKTAARYLKSCFDVKKSWSLERITANANTAYLGNLLTFTAEIDGDTSDLDYNITIYKDGASYNFIEGAHKVEFYPNTQGTYYAVIVATDFYGESQTAQSSNVIVKTQSVKIPLFLLIMVRHLILMD